MIYAHSADPAGRWQPLDEHLAAVQALAAEFAAPYGLDDLAGWVGWWHDVGKVTDAFQAYLRGEGGHRGPDHSSAGMLQAERVAIALSFCIAGHHGGLVDAGDLVQRCRRKARDPEVTAALATAREQLGAGPETPSQSRLLALFNDPSKPALRRQVFLIRMIHSALVDADCLDTERHFNPELAARRGASPGLDALLARLDERLASFAADSAVNGHRAAVLAACRAAAEQPPGFFRLTVPTGGGKTLSGMAFALRHALAHGQRRVIVALPFTSIIEQNAAVYRDILGEEAVLEHHSAAGGQETGGEASEAEQRARLAADNWDRPVVVTTTVQFFESLFAARNSRLRKLHHIAQAVILLDEVQTLPVPLLTPTLEVLRILVEEYGCTIVLSSATQPALGERDGLVGGLGEVPEIVPEAPGLFQALRRVSYELPAADDAPWAWDDVADALGATDQGLVVLNTINDAQQVYEAAEQAGAAGLYHLSTRLCAAHRRAVLAEIRARLAAGEACRVVSTQVVEAGVDLDFPVVLRALGPLDRIVQAAGRCNREGRRESGRVIVFEPAEGSQPPGLYRTAVDTTRNLLREQPAPDLHDPAIFERYFRRLYSVCDLDERCIIRQLTDFKFATVADLYQLIADDGEAVIVRYGPWQAVIDETLDRLRAIGRWTTADFRRLQPVLVTLKRHACGQLRAQGLVVEVAPEVLVWEGRYDDRLGLVTAGRPGDWIV